MSHPKRMLLGFAVGTATGITANFLSETAPILTTIIESFVAPAGQVFLRLLFMLVVPLLFCALVIGVAELDLKQLGRLGLKTLMYTIVVSSIAVLIGITLVNVFQPGAGASEKLRELASSGTVPAAATALKDTSASALLIAIVPDNPIKAAAGGDMIGLIFFSLVFGIAMSLVHSESAKTVRNFINGVYEITMKILDGVMSLAPIGIAALICAMTARLGIGILAQLAAYIGVVLLALAIHMFGVYSISVKYFGGRSPVGFFKDVRLAMLTAFSTSSSSATLPTALRVAEENLKLPSHVSRFVLTAGSAMNQNGTALFEGVTVLFLAQVFGVEMDISRQIIVVLICVLGGIGTAGVPAGSLPVIAMILGMFGIPPEGLGLIMGVDRFLDMCRTTLNVTGDLAAAVFVARGEEAN